MNEFLTTVFKKGENMKTNVTRAAAMAASAGFAAMALSVSCTKDRVALPDTDGGATGSVTVRASIAGYYGDDHSAGAGNAVRDLQACIFEDGRMTGIFDNLSLSGGSCDLAIDGHSGTLYMLANTAAPDGSILNADGAWTVNGTVQTTQIINIEDEGYTDKISNLVYDLMNSTKSENRRKYGIPDRGANGYIYPSCPYIEVQYGIPEGGLDNMGYDTENDHALRDDRIDND